MPKPPRGEAPPMSPERGPVAEEEPPTLEFDPAALERVRDLIGDDADTAPDPLESGGSGVADPGTEIGRRLRDAVLADGDAETVLNIGARPRPRTPRITAWDTAARRASAAQYDRSGAGQTAYRELPIVEHGPSRRGETSVVRTKKSEMGTEVQFNVVGYGSFLAAFREKYGNVSSALMRVTLENKPQFESLAREFSPEFLQVYKDNFFLEEQFPPDPRYESDRAEAERVFGPFILAYEKIQAARSDLESRYAGYGFRDKDSARRYWVDALTAKIGGVIAPREYDMPSTKTRDFFEGIPEVYVRQFTKRWADIQFERVQREVSGNSAIIREEGETVLSGAVDRDGSEEDEPLVVPVTDELPLGDTQLLPNNGGRKSFLAKIGWPWFGRK